MFRKSDANLKLFATVVAPVMKLLQNEQNNSSEKLDTLGFVEVRQPVQGLFLPCVIERV